MGSSLPVPALPKEFSSNTAAPKEDAISLSLRSTYQ